MTLIENELYVTPHGELLKYLYPNHFEFIVTFNLRIYSDNIQPGQVIFYLGETKSLVPYKEYKIRQEIKKWIEE